MPYIFSHTCVAVRMQIPWQVSRPKRSLAMFRLSSEFALQVLFCHGRVEWNKEPAHTSTSCSSLYLLLPMCVCCWSSDWQVAVCTSVSHNAFAVAVRSLRSPLNQVMLHTAFMTLQVVDRCGHPCCQFNAVAASNYMHAWEWCRWCTGISCQPQLASACISAGSVAWLCTPGGTPAVAGIIMRACACTAQPRHSGRVLVVIGLQCCCDLCA